MDFLWSSPKKLEGSDNNGGSTISSCVEQLIGGISDILSFENILESTASSLEDDEDENELEDESLLQDGSVKTCSVDEDGDVCRSVSQTKEELSGSVQPAITDSTEPVSDHKHTQIQADNDDTEEDNEAVQNNKDLRPSDNTTAVLQHSLTSQQSRESTNENSAPTQTPDVTRDTFPGNILKGDRGLVSDSNGVNKGEALATEFVSTEEEVSTTSSDTNTAQSEAANPTNTLDDTIHLPQQHISSEAARFPKDTVQQEMLDHDHDHDVGSSMPQDESDGSSAAMSLKLGGEDVLESGACSPCPDISTTEVSTTESEGDSNKARESKSSHVLQMMETVVKEDIQQYNTSSQSVLDIAAHISSSDSDNALHRGKVPQQNTDTVGPLSSTPVQSTDQQDTPVPGDPEGGETAPPRAPATVQGDREESKGAPIIGEQYQHQQQQVSSTEPEPQSLTEPPLKEPELWNRQSGYQRSDPASLATVPLVLPAPESASLHPESVHASHENLPSDLTAQDSAAVGQEVTSMEQKGEETSSADDPSRDAPQVNGDKELEQQPITEQQDKPASEELSHQPITAQLIKGELGEAMRDKKEPELELEVKEDNEESGDDDAGEDSRTQSALSSLSLEGMVSTDDQPSRSKYNTVCYRKIKRGNTKQRIDEFESMMNF